MKLLLINPSGGYHHEYPPLGLLSIAACLREDGHQIAFLDDGVLPQPNNQFLSLLNEHAPDVVLISLYTTNISRGYEMIRRIRSERPKVKIIVGGHHATALPEQTLQECPEIDLLVSGEGEKTVAEIISALEGGVGVEQVKGIFISSRDGRQFTFTGERPFIDDLDSLPMPAHDLIKLEDYQKNSISVGHRVGSLVTSRGCPFSCVFCNKSVFKSRIRRRSAENICDEIEYLITEKGVDEIYFQDDLFALDRKWLHEFVSVLHRRRLTLPWRILARVDILRKDDFAMIRKAGCYLVQFGVESGNDEILRDIKKNITKSQVRAAFRDAREVGLLTYGFFIFGHRLDTLKTIAQTFALAKEIRCDFTSFFLLVPFPGTDVYELLPEAQRQDWSRIQYVNWNKGLDPFSICEVPGSQLKAIEEQVNMEYYCRPAYLFFNVLGHRGPLKLMFLKFKWWLTYMRAFAWHLLRFQGRALRRSSC